MNRESSGFLPTPPGPNIVDRCPRCARPEPLEFVRTAPDDLVGELRYYVCTACGHEVAFARALPGHCL